MMNYKNCWLTLNRACNLRCKWCYARNTEYKNDDYMSAKTAYRLIDLCKDLAIKHITLIGGEITIYPHLFEVIDYCHKQNIACGIVTNGLQCKNEPFVKKLKLHGINKISLSLKGENADAYKDITSVDAFDDIITAVKNCFANGIRVGVSMVLTEDNINTYLEGIKTMKSVGVNSFHLSFCYNFNASKNESNYLKLHNPKRLIQLFIATYRCLDLLTEHNFRLQSGYPLCLWDDKLLNEMSSKGQIDTICQLLSKSGLIFDCQGNIIPCNAMHEIKLGQLNKDFKTAKDLVELTKTPSFKNAYNKLCGLPDESCLSCKKLPYCGGGCVCQWTNYDFKRLMKTLCV